MAISSSLSAGVSGLNANANKLATISDNIANSQTYGYKRADVDFSSIAIGFIGTEPRRLELVDGLGQITRIELDNLVVNPEIADDVFKLDVPPGVDVNGDG